MPVHSRKKHSEKTFTLIPRHKLLALYAGLLRSRLLEEFVRQKIVRARTHSRLGHEAPAVALAIDLKRGDTIAARTGDFLPGFINEQDLKTALADLRSPSRTTFAARLKAALAAARIHQQERDGRIAVIFCPVAAIQSRAWRKALEVAGAERLPILFVSDYDSGREGEPRLKFPAITVDRDDVVALYRVASEAMAHARRGNGATLIECLAWHPRHEQEGSLSPNANTDPITNMERYLEQRGIHPGRSKARVKAEFERRLGPAGRSGKL